MIVIASDTPICGDVVCFHPGRDDRRAGHRPSPGIVQFASRTGDELLLTVTVFLADGATVLRDRVMHISEWRHRATDDPSFDADATSCWCWPGEETTQ